MIGLFWNIRGLGKIGRLPALRGRIASTRADFVGIMETKKDLFTLGYLKSLTNTPFDQFYLPAKNTVGGILVGCNSDKFATTLVATLDFTVSVMLLDKKTGFSWKLVVVYGSAYEEGKEEFISELHQVLESWQGPIVIGGDFNLIRFAHEKNNDNVNYRCVDAFNGWVHKWGLLELNAPNRKFTWSNNQENLVMAKLDRIFVSTDWISSFPLSTVNCLDRFPSDHNPLVLDFGVNMFFGKKYFRFEKWWLQQEDFPEVVRKAWDVSCLGLSSIDKWQTKIRSLRKCVRGQALNEVAKVNKLKTDLALEYIDLEETQDREGLSVAEQTRFYFVARELDKIWALEEIKAGQRSRDRNILE